MKTKLKGFTIIEASIVLTLSMFATVGTFKYMSDQAEETRVNSLSSKIVSAVSGFDQRVYIDGYDQALWPTVEDYVTNSQVKDFLARELISSKSSCGDSVNGWNPVIIDAGDSDEVSYKNNLKLISCDPWGENGKLEFGVKSSLYFDRDTTDLERINMYFKFETEEEFSENLLHLKKVLKKVKELDSNNITGSHNYAFVDMSKAEPYNHTLTMKECIDKNKDCGLMAQYSSDGNGLEHLDVTGQNSMIGSKVSFVPQSGGSVVKDCVSFIKDASGNWIYKDNLICGIGFNKDSSNNLLNNYVHADVYSTTSQRVFLDKECTLVTDPTDPDNSKVLVPCGMATDYGATQEAITVVDRIEAPTAYIELLDVKNVYADKLSVKNELKVTGNTELNTLDVSDVATFNDVVELKADGNIAKDLKVAGETQADVLRVIANSTFEKDVTVLGTLKVDGYIEADHLRLDALDESDINQNCSVEGAMKIVRDTGREHSEPVICSKFTDVDGTAKTAWKLANVRVGQVMPFDGSCPAGFEYFTKAAGRFLIGANENSISNSGDFLDQNGDPVVYRVGDTGGEAFHKLTEAEMPEHDHEVPTIARTCSGTNCAGSAMVEMNNSDTVWSKEMEIPTGSAGQGQSHENRPPYYAVNYCMYTGK